MDRDEIKGKIEKVKGAAKDPELEAEGEVERDAGAAREGYGKAKRKVREGIENVTEATDDDDR